MSSLQLTNSFTPENFYRSQLTSDITSSATDIFLDTVPTYTEGTLVIDPDSAANREIIYFNSKTATKVVLPSAALGRGYDNTTATTHTAGTTVIMAPIADWFNSMRTLFTTTSQGWTSVGSAPNTVTANGNRSYSLVFNSVDLTSTLSVGMRLKLTRTVTAPTQCSDLESSSSQYFSKTTPAGLSFTDDWTAMGWVKLESYVAGGIIARRNADTEGWSLGVTSTGRVVAGSYRIAANNSVTTSAHALPLNRWVHVAATTDLSGTSVLIYIDGVLVPSATTITGTITALVQGTTALVVGAEKSAGTNPLDGKIAQAAVFSAVLTASTICSYMSQGLSGSETNLVSAYSLSNSIVDLNTTNANDLTAQGSALATATDTPFAGGSVGTTEYGIISAIAFSTNTTATVQVAEGYAIPTTGGVSAVAYATHKVPYSFPADVSKWDILTLSPNDRSTTSTTLATLTDNIIVPIGAWQISFKAALQHVNAGTNNRVATLTLSSDLSTETHPELTISDRTVAISNFTRSSFSQTNVALTSATTFTMMAKTDGSTDTVAILGANLHRTMIRAEFNLL